MARQSSLDEIQSESFTLSGLRNTLQDRRNSSLDDVTITVGFDSPDSFRHEWTFQDVTTVEEYQDELDTTEDAAYNRLKQGWMSDDRDESQWRDKVRNEISLEIKDKPSDIESWKDDKAEIPALREAVQETRNVYNKSGDRSRNISIAQKLDNRSENVEDYMENLDRVDANLDFEENVEGGDVLLEDRQRTTGDLTWYTEDGQERFFLVQSTGVVVQEGRGGREITRFSDKSRAWEYYQSNKLA